VRKPNANPRARSRSARSTARSEKPSRRATVARENGRRGGRPKATLPLEVSARLGPPPEKPLDLARWQQRYVAELAYLLGVGQVDRGLAGAISSILGKSARLMPLDVMAAVEDEIKRSDALMKAPDAGPQLEEEDRDGQPGAAPIRCPPAR
jgi:hypothetical protein